VLSAIDSPLTSTDNYRNLNMTDINTLTFDALVPSNSKYLSKADVGEDGLVLTIKGFRNEPVKGDDGEEDKVVLHFVEEVNPMILNRTNSQLIGVCTGAKTAGEAKGKQIVVFNDPTIAFGGKITGGLRIKKVTGQPRAAQGAPLPNADIPW
jgi:hypothetical protein